MFLFHGEKTIFELEKKNLNKTLHEKKNNGIKKTKGTKNILIYNQKTKKKNFDFALTAFLKVVI